MRNKRIMALFAAVVSIVALLALAACGQQTQPSSSAASESSEMPEVTSEVGSDAPFYALLVGNDSRYGTIEGDGVKESDPSYGDTIMLVRVDPGTHRISELSIPRDTAAVVEGIEEKINLSHMAGVDAMVKQVEQLTGTDISYYFDMRFIDFTKFIDDVEGVTVDVPVNMSWTDIVNGGKVKLTAGPDQTLDGPEALVFVRQRKQYVDYGEACRQVNARQLVQNLITKVAAQPSSQAESYATILEAVCKTNMDHQVLVDYLTDFMDNSSAITFQLGTGPYFGDIDSTDTWRVTRDEDAYAQLVDLMENGGDLTTIVELPEMVVSE